MAPLDLQSQRVRQELKEARVTAFGRIKFASRFLPKVLHEDEHIKAAVYGRYGTQGNVLTWSEGMLIATDRRILFVDRKPGFDNIDELTYDVVSGIKKMRAWPFASVTLHTRVNDYTLRFANPRCIDTFMRYVEIRRLEPVNYYGMRNTFIQDKPAPPPALDGSTMTFLNNHETGVLSTVDYYGNAHGAVVHYYVQPADQRIYIATRAGSKKAQNIFTHRQVALTIYDDTTLQTLQLRGDAEVETDQLLKKRLIATLSKPHIYGDRMELPPITKMHNGDIFAVRIMPYSARLSNFNAGSIGEITQ